MAEDLETQTLALAEMLLAEGLVKRSEASLAAEAALQEAGDAALPYWQALLENEAESCRITAAFNLALRARESDLGEGVVGALARHALEDSAPRVRRQALAAVVEARGSTAASLAQAVARDADPEVNGYARASLEQLDIPGSDAIALCDLVDYDVAERIAQLLIRGIDEADPPESFLTERSAHARARREAVAFAARAADEPDGADLIDMRALALFVARDPDPEVRAHAARALEKLVPEESEPLVKIARERGYLDRRDVELLELTGTLAKAEGTPGDASAMVALVVQRVTGAAILG